MLLLTKEKFKIIILQEYKPLKRKMLQLCYFFDMRESSNKIPFLMMRTTFAYLQDQEEK